MDGKIYDFQKETDMMLAAQIYLGIGLVIATMCAAMKDRINYKFTYHPVLVVTLVIFLWLPAITAALLDSWRKK